MVRKCLFHAVILVSLVQLCISQYSIEYTSEPSACVQCMNNRTCRPPDCFCCRDELRLPMSEKDIPQIVFFTFDDALTDSATKFYHRLFNESRKNPNGCPVSMTLFVSHHDTVYSNVNYMYRKGMEIAAHSVSHAHMSNENFMNEAQNQKQNLAKLGGVPENEIVGWRSPFLEPVGDMQPDSLKKLGYTYDATLTYSKRSLKDKAPTPFTLDFGWPYDCKVKPCPKRRHFGFWEVPVVSLLDYKHKYDCVYVDGCNNPPPDETSAYNFLMDNFNSYYSKHRVPFGINMHPSWFYIPERLNAMDRFIQKLSQLDDVFIVSVKKMIDWLKNPTGLSQINSFKPWQCPKKEDSQNSHATRGKQLHSKRNEWNGQSDAIAQRKSYIQARLEQIRAMRREKQKALSEDVQGFQESNDVRKTWWINHSNQHKVQEKKQEKPAAIAPWVHKKHDRPVKENARKPAIITPVPSPEIAREVPFWKRKGNLKSSPKTSHQDVAWWEKAIPQTQSVTAGEHKSAVTDKSSKSGVKVTISEQEEHVHHEHTGQHMIQKTVGVNAPPKVDFEKQLKEQELKQLAIIEKQKKLQKEQLLLQIQRLNENNKQVFKRQQEEEARRMKEIEQKLASNNQKSIEMNKEPIVIAQENLQTTVVSMMNQEATTAAPQSGKFSFLTDKNNKMDPWTRFVQFIIRNKPS